MTGYEPFIIEIYIWEKGIVLRDLSVVAYDRNTHKIRAVGYEAMNLSESDIEVVSPFKNGQIAEWDAAVRILEYYIYKVNGKHVPFKKPVMAVCMAPEATGIEKKAMEDAIYLCGARKVILSELPLERFLAQSSKKECALIVSIHPEGK